MAHTPSSDIGVDDADTGPAKQEGNRQPELSRAGMIAVLAGSALAPIDLFIVNVALPAIKSGLRSSSTELGWVVAAYGLAFAVLLVLGGRLGDAFGRRRLFVLGLTSFTTASLVCGLAPNIISLVAARAWQGASAALLAPQALSIIHANTGAARRTRAIGYYGATGGASMVIGQLAGGLLVSADIAGMDWRPVFLVNVPIGIAAIALTLRTVPLDRGERSARLDLVGTLFLSVVLLLLLVPLMEGASLGWPAWCWCALALCPVAGYGFAQLEARREGTGVDALVPPSILRLSSLRIGLGVALPFFVVLGGFLYVWALTLQDELHISPLLSGVALSPLGAGFLALALLAHKLVTRLGNRLIVFGGITTALGLAVLLVTISISWPAVPVAELVPGSLVLGIGLGSIAPSLFRIVLSGIPADIAGVGSGVLTTTQQVSSALGVATLGTLFTTLSDPTVTGVRSALIITLVIGCALSLGLSVLATRLPDPEN